MDYMFKEDLEQRYFTFGFPKDINADLTRFVLYNEKESQFPVMATMYSTEDYIKIDALSLNHHLQYKYKYQIKQNGKWVTSKPYKYLYVNYKDENNVKYRLYREPTSNYLLVCFSGNGNVPSYNYVGAFSNLNVNRLYIKDDFTDKTPNKSVFYVGTERQNEVMDNISKLISKVAKNINVSNENIISAGTSKGGYAAVLYALTNGYGQCVVGSPTLYLGNSLLVEGNLRKHAKVISGGTNEHHIGWLNEILLKKIEDAQKCNIHVIIGTGERRYNKHLIPFMKSSKVNSSINFYQQLENFEEHNKVAKVYPPFARDVIKNIIE